MAKRPTRYPLPTEAEDADINAGIAADPDTREMTDADFARMRPASEVLPDLVANPPRVRGQQKAPTKTAVSIRLDKDIVEALRATGRGWQGRANDLLRAAMKL